jgi:hypothetical protein
MIVTSATVPLPNSRGRAPNLSAASRRARPSRRHRSAASRAAATLPAAASTCKRGARRVTGPPADRTAAQGQTPGRASGSEARGCFQRHEASPSHAASGGGPAPEKGLRVPRRAPGPGASGIRVARSAVRTGGAR